MIWSTPSIQDTTIYEIDPYRNTGLDQILELSKKGDSSTSDLTESRILIKFNLDGLSSILTENNITINDVTASLKLYTVQESDVPTYYNIEAKILTKEWVNGTSYLYFPAADPSSTTDVEGATWITVGGTGTTAWTSSIASNMEIIYNEVTGGGSWYTSSIVSQSFSYKVSDTFDVNVTNAVKSWYNGTLSNYGFLLSFKHDEITGSNYPETTLQFYSCDTHTVYEPQLYISWNDSQVYSIGSLSVATYEDSPVIYVRNFRSEYLKDKRNRILLGTRPKYPRPSFSQNTTFSGLLALPTSSYYQIKDAHSNEIIIPYSDSTKINSTTEGSYFDFYSTMMYPERYYKFEIKSTLNGLTEYFSSNEFIFKIVR